MADINFWASQRLCLGLRRSLACVLNHVRKYLHQKMRAVNGSSDSMIRWVRLVLTVLALSGVLSARPDASSAAPSATHKQQHHHCVGLMDDQSCPSDSIGSVPACCVAATCAMIQPAFLTQDGVRISRVEHQLKLPLRDDLWRTGVRPSPGLRPPIA